MLYLSTGVLNNLKQCNDQISFDKSTYNNNKSTYNNTRLGADVV